MIRATPTQTVDPGTFTIVKCPHFGMGGWKCNVPIGAKSGYVGLQHDINGKLEAVWVEEQLPINDD